MSITKSQQSILAIFFFTSLFILYYATGFDKVSFGDCIGYINIIEDGDYIITANSSAHFLYTNSMVFFKNITQLETIQSVKIFNAIASTIALYMIYKTLDVLFGSYRLSILGTLIFALSFTFWRISSTIEVCSFNTIFLSLFLYYSIIFFKSKKNEALLTASLVLGISFWVHVQNIMLIPSLIYLHYIAYKKFNIINKTGIVLFIIIALLKFLPSYLQNESMSGVYGSTNPKWVTGTFTKSIMQYITDIVKSIGYLVYNFWYFLIPGLIALYHRFRKPSYLNQFLAVAFLIPFAFGTFYNVSDNYVYFIGPYLIILIYIIDGIKHLNKKFKRIITYSFILAMAIPCFYVISYLLAINTEKGLQFHQEKGYKGGLNYYLYPWMNNNAGILEHTIKKEKSSDDIYWMIESANEFINKKRTTNSIEEIKEL